MRGFLRNAIKQFHFATYATSTLFNIVHKSSWWSPGYTHLLVPSANNAPSSMLKPRIYSESIGADGTATTCHPNPRHGPWTIPANQLNYKHRAYKIISHCITDSQFTFHSEIFANVYFPTGRPFNRANYKNHPLFFKVTAIRKFLCNATHCAALWGLRQNSTASYHPWWQPHFKVPTIISSFRPPTHCSGERAWLRQTYT